MEVWGPASVLSPENRAVSGTGCTLPPYVSWERVSAAAAAGRRNAAAGDAERTQRSPRRVHSKNKRKKSLVNLLVRHFFPRKPYFITLTSGQASFPFVLSTAYTHRTELFDWAPELYRFGDGDDPFEPDLLLFHYIRWEADVWALITKDKSNFTCRRLKGFKTNVTNTINTYVYFLTFM